MEQLEQFLQVLPLSLFLLFVGVLSYYARKETKAVDFEWEKEEKRKARVRALSPQPSYEERMGVSYGPTGTQDK